MAPEYAMEGRFSEKSDVYSFGVLMLEIVKGKRITHYYNSEHNLSLLGYVSLSILINVLKIGMKVEFCDIKFSSLTYIKPSKTDRFNPIPGSTSLIDHYALVIRLLKHLS